MIFNYPALGLTVTAETSQEAGVIVAQIIRDRQSMSDYDLSGKYPTVNFASIITRKEVEKMSSPEAKTEASDLEVSQTPSEDSKKPKKA